MASTPRAFKYDGLDVPFAATPPNSPTAQATQPAFESYSETCSIEMDAAMRSRNILDGISNLDLQRPGFNSGSKSSTNGQKNFSSQNSSSSWSPSPRTAPRDIHVQLMSDSQEVKRNAKSLRRTLQVSDKASSVILPRP
jgi:hypothetical protein